MKPSKNVLLTGIVEEGFLCTEFIFRYYSTKAK